MNPKNQKFLKTDVPIARYSIAKYCPLFFQTTRQTKVLGTFFVRLEQMNPKNQKFLKTQKKCWEPFLCVSSPKNQKFLKTDVPIARYSIAKYCPPFFFKIFKNGRSYRPLFNCKVLPPFFFQTTRQTKVLGTFFFKQRRKCWEPFLCVSSR